jgi:hypothetical protein
MARRRIIAAGLGGLLLFVGVERESRADCDGPHGLRAPLPDECLGPIDTDRPHQTDTPHVVPAGHTQFESALGSVPLGGRLGAPPGARGAHVVFFDTAYKFGIASHMDLQLIEKHVDYVPSARSFDAPGPLNVRAKFNVVEEDGFVPAVTFVPTVFAPMAREHAFRAGALVFLGWELPANLELEVNAGVLGGASPKPPLVVVLASALTIPIAGGLRTFIDVYASGFDVSLGTGLLFPLGRDAQIDAGTYIGLNGDVPVATPFLGLSIRL